MAAHEDGRVASPQDHFPLHAFLHANRVYHRGYVLLSHIGSLRVSQFSSTFSGGFLRHSVDAVGTH